MSFPVFPINDTGFLTLDHPSSTMEIERERVSADISVRARVIILPYSENTECVETAMMAADKVMLLIAIERCLSACFFPASFYCLECPLSL